MPMHDWTRVPSGLFHDFHQTWCIQLKVALNAGILPPGLAALVEQRAGYREADVLAIDRWGKRPVPSDEIEVGGVATLGRPQTRLMFSSPRQSYATRASRIAIKHHLGRTVAIIEIVGPGNKDSRAAVRDFVAKTLDFVKAGVHVLIVDLFPPSSRDPLGLHALIWDEIGADETLVFPSGTDRLLASYQAGPVTEAFIEPLAVGDPLPDMPLFLAEGLHVKVPLESTYQSAWLACPAALHDVVETGVVPNPDAGP